MQPATTKAEREVTVGQRIAGGLMLLCAIGFVASKLLLPLETGEHWYTGIGGGVADLLLGVWLLRGRGRAVNWAIAKALLGLVGYPLVQLAHEPFTLVALVTISEFGLLLLLVGHARVRRIAAGILAAAPYLALLTVGLYAAITERPVAALGRLVGEDDGLTAAPAELSGVAGEYVFEIPATGWRLRPRETPAAGELQVDLALSRPDVAAEFAILVEPREDAPLADPDELVEVVLANDRAGADHYDVVSREPLARYPAIGRLVHTRDTRGDEQTDTLIAVIVTRQLEYRIVAFAPHADFPAVETELRALIDSFTLTARKSP